MIFRQLLSAETGRDEVGAIRPVGRRLAALARAATALRSERTKRANHHESHPKNRCVTRVVVERGFECSSSCLPTCFKACAKPIALAADSILTWAEERLLKWRPPSFSDSGA